MNGWQQILAVGIGWSGAVLWQMWQKKRKDEKTAEWKWETGKEEQPVVYFLGAGPGKPEWLTLQGKAILEQADVILVDALVPPPTYFPHVPSTTRVIKVGKRGGDPTSMKQTEISKCIVSHALEGKRVVRLKGGDPLIFGRLMAEMETLMKSNIPFCIVPGITAASAAAAVSHLPLTRTHSATSLLYLSGHDVDAINYDHFVSVDTIVLYMATKNLSILLQNGLRAGLLMETPVAVVRSATCMQQQIMYSTVDRMLSENTFVESPAIVLIGEGARPLV